MSSPKHHIDKIEINGEILRKYHAGELPADQMYAVEKQLLEDEFASEAYEGLGQLSDEEWAKDINALQTTLQQRTAQQPSSLWPKAFKVAAALALLLISTFLVINWWPTSPQKQTIVQNGPNDTPNDNLETRQEDEGTPDNTDSLTGKFRDPQLKDQQALALDNSSIQQNTSEQLDRSTTMSDSEAPPPEDKKQESTDEAAVPNEQEPYLALNEESLALNEEAPDNREQAKTKAEPPTRSRGEAELKESTVEDISGDDISKSEFPGSDVDSNVKRRSPHIQIRGLSTVDIPYNSISGQVYDEEGTPLPGANIILKGTNQGTVADMEGYFQLNIPQQGGEILVALIGFESREISVQPQSMVNIQLNTDVSQLSEVVVIGMGSGTGKSDYRAYEAPRPSIGKKAFNNYLSANLMYPEAARQAGVEGKVVITFILLPDGQLTDLQIKKGLGYGCDEEALRLITEGPNWTPANRNGQLVEEKVKVKVPFVLPR